MKKVFLIDQVKFLCSMVEMALKHEGIETFTLQSTHDSIYIIEDLRPDALILDMKTLASGDYQEFFHKIQKSDILSRIPLIGLGKPQDKDLIENGTNQFCGYIEKPLSPAGLGKRIKSLLSLQPQNCQEALQ